METGLLFEQIEQNKRKTWILIIGFSLFITGLGLLFGYNFGSPEAGIIIALVIAVVYILIAYKGANTWVLSISRAQQADRKEHRMLYNLVEGLCLAGGLYMPKIYVIQDDAPNAFATGMDEKNGAVIVTTGLLGKLNKEELEGVLAHELSHINNRDSQLMVITIALVGVVALLSDLMLRSMFFGSSRRRAPVKGGGQLGVILVVVGLLLAVLGPIAAQLIRLAISRNREFLADAYAVKLTRNPEGLIRALKKLTMDKEPLKVANKATAHLYIINPLIEHRGKLNSLFNTHPSIDDRIAALKKM